MPTHRSSVEPARSSLTTVGRVWDGKANLVELEANCPDGHFEGLSLRLNSLRGVNAGLEFKSTLRKIGRLRINRRFPIP